MKKYFLPLLIFIVLPVISIAQKHRKEFGIEPGVSFSSARGEAINTASKKSLTGFAIGGYYKLLLSRNFGLKAVLVYNRNGWTYRDLVFASGPGDAFIKLNYLNLPLLASYSFGNGVKFNIDGGVFAGYLVSNKTTIKISGATPSTENSSSSSYRKINFGVTAGASAQITVAPYFSLDIGVRNNFGLANINTSNSSHPSTIKTNAFSILTGLTFHFL